MKKYGAGIVVLVLFFLKVEAHAGSWMDIDKAVCVDLEKKGMAGTIRSLNTATDKFGKLQWMQLFDLGSRAANYKMIRKAMQALSSKENCPSVEDLSGMAAALLSRSQWKVAAEFLEKFPEANPGNAYLAAQHFDSATSARLYKWISNQCKIASQQWMPLRIDAAVRTNKLPQLLKELIADLQKSPTVEKARAYVLAANQSPNEADLTLLSTVYKPTKVADCIEVALQMRSNSACYGALLERALSLPTNKDEEKVVIGLLGGMGIHIFPPKQSEKLRHELKLMLLNCRKARYGSAKFARLEKELLEEDARLRALKVDRSSLPPRVDEFPPAPGFPRVVYSNYSPSFWQQYKGMKEWNIYMFKQAADSTPPAQLATFWQDGEAAAANDPKKLYALASTMVQCKDPERAIKLLKTIASRPVDEKLKFEINTALVDAYLSPPLNDWRFAEKLYPELRPNLSLEQLPQWWANLSEVAARAGDKKDAIRLWSHKDDLDRTLIAPLYSLGTRPVQPDFISYYKRMAVEEPDSYVPPRALRLLRAKGAAIESQYME